MDGAGMVAAHGNGHAAHATGERPAAQQAAAVQRFDACALTDAEFAQPLGLAEREAVPFHLIYESWLTQGQLMQMQERLSVNFANDYHYPDAGASLYFRSTGFIAVFAS
jgi:hypothetical protein